MTRKKLAIIVLGLILLVSLLACGYFGFKTFRRSHQRRVAMATYEKKDYVLAERLLLAYVSQDQNSELEFVALANIYHEFGNYGMEAQMWQRAAALNPLNGEYQRNMLDAAVKSASYYLLYSAPSDGESSRAKHWTTAIFFSTCFPATARVISKTSNPSASSIILTPTPSRSSSGKAISGAWSGNSPRSSRTRRPMRRLWIA